MQNVIKSWYTDVRLTRSSYFFSQIGQYVVFMVAAVTAAFWGGVFQSEKFTGFLLFLFFIPFAYAQFRIIINRLNDLDLSGWYSPIILIPLVGIVFGFFILLAPGTEGPNKYGENRV